MRQFCLGMGSLLAALVISACSGGSSSSAAPAPSPSSSGGTTTGGTTGGTTGSTTGGTTTGGTTGSGGGGIPIDSAGFLPATTLITRSSQNDGAASIIIADGTTAQSYTMSVNGTQRRYVVIRPVNASANAPILLLLHPDHSSPETMANLSEVSDYVLTQGFWAVLPEGIGGTWNDDPGTADNPSVDLPFFRQLIDTLPSLGSVDLQRVYAAGFSNGGFMTERLSCELADRIAAFGIDAATLKNTLAAVCTPAKQRARIYFLGTADLIVAYNGTFSGTSMGLKSAVDTMAYWAAGVQQGCGGLVSTPMPDRDPTDGTTVQLNDYTGCGGGTRLQLYTINGGGHAWPGGQPSGLGTTTQDIQATGLIWRFASSYLR